MHIVDSEMLAFSQGKTRRGSYAVYQDISHPEIEEFLEIRKPSGGDIHRKCLNLHHGVNISDEFMHIIDKCSNDRNLLTLIVGLLFLLSPQESYGKRFWKHGWQQANRISSFQTRLTKAYHRVKELWV